MKNAELMALCSDLPNLRVRRDIAQDAVTTALSNLRELEMQIEQAGRVTDVIDGICLHVDKDSDGCWFKAQTLEPTECAGVLTAYLYEMAHSKPYWAVRINEIGQLNRCVHNLERWFGGNVIGLGQTMSYAEAKALALRWLLGNGQLP
jgi:hypothetical protein